MMKFIYHLTINNTEFKRLFPAPKGAAFQTKH